MNSEDSTLWGSGTFIPKVLGVHLTHQVSLSVPLTPHTFTFIITAQAGHFPIKNRSETYVHTKNYT